MKSLARIALLLSLFTAATSLGGCATLFARGGPQSVEILDRKETEKSVSVKHVLISWAWLAQTYRQIGLKLDRRAEGRTQADAEKLVTDILARLRAGERIEPLMREFSEDEGSAQNGMAYPVTPDSRMAGDFIDLALRLKVGESGIVKSKFGYHVMWRER